MNKFIISAVFILLNHSVQAQNKALKFPTVIVCECYDNIGRLFGTELKDIVAKSPRYTLENNTEESRKYGFTIYALSMADYADASGTARRSAFAIAFIQDNIYIGHIVLVCDTSSVEQCAKNTMAVYDTAIERVTKH